MIGDAYANWRGRRAAGDAAVRADRALEVKEIQAKAAKLAAERAECNRLYAKEALAKHEAAKKVSREIEADGRRIGQLEEQMERQHFEAKKRMGIKP